MPNQYTKAKASNSSNEILQTNVLDASDQTKAQAGVDAQPVKTKQQLADEAKATKRKQTMRDFAAKKRPEVFVALDIKDGCVSVDFHKFNTLKDAAANKLEEDGMIAVYKLDRIVTTKKVKGKLVEENLELV